MPNRIVREAILSSERVAALGWPEEVLYRRLMSIVDDYGRHEAKPQLLRSKCYPLQTDAVRVADITRWMAACQKAGLVVLYEAQGKQYLEIANFGQQQRAKSKCPDPPANQQHSPTSDNTCYQTPTDEHLVVVGVEGVISKPTASHPGSPGDARFDAFWQAYPRKVGKDAARKAFDKRKPDAALLALMLDAIAKQARSDAWLKDAGQFIPHPSTWLNEGRWMDEETEPAAPTPLVPLYVPPAPMTQAEREASDRARRAALSAVRGITA